MNARDYQGQTLKTFKAMADKAAEAQSAIAELDKREASAQNSLSMGVIGKVGFDQIKRQCDEGRKRAMEELGQSVDALIREMDSAASICFTPNAADLDAEGLKLIDHVDLTEAEIRSMARDFKARSYTTARALYTQAARRGIDLHDDAPAYVAQVGDTMREFSKYCLAMPSDGVFQKNWGAVVEKFGSVLSELNSAYLTRDGYSGDEAKAYGSATPIAVQGASVMQLVTEAAGDNSGGATSSE